MFKTDLLEEVVMELSDLLSPEGIATISVGLAVTGAYVISQRERIIDAVFERIGYTAAPIMQSKGIRQVGPGFYEQGPARRNSDDRPIIILPNYDTT